MEAKFKIGDYIRHKDKEKADKLFLQGQIVNICQSDRGVDFYLMRPELAILVENQDNYEKVEIHNCNVCGKPLAWDENIWINSNFGVCHECHDKIPEHIDFELQEENYTDEVKDFLNKLGASY